MVKDAVVNLGQSIVDGLIGTLQSIVDGLTTLGNFIVDGIKGILEFLFVPSENLFDDIVDVINSKFGIFSQVIEIAKSLTFDYNNDTPKFTITWHGKEMPILDFSFFSQYKTFIHGIILVIAYYRFINWLIASAPAVIGGFNTVSSREG